MSQFEHGDLKFRLVCKLDFNKEMKKEVKLINTVAPPHTGLNCAGPLKCRLFSLSTVWYCKCTFSSLQF